MVTSKIEQESWRGIEQAAPAWGRQYFPVYRMWAFIQPVDAVLARPLEL